MSGLHWSDRETPPPYTVYPRLILLVTLALFYGAKICFSFHFVKCGYLLWVLFYVVCICYSYEGGEIHLTSTGLIYFVAIVLFSYHLFLLYFDFLHYY